MRLENLDINGLSESEFRSKVANMQKVLKRFAERGRDELGYDVALISVLGVTSEDNDEIFSADVSFGGPELMLNLGQNADVLQRVIQLSKHYEISEFIDGIMNGEYSEGDEYD